MPLPALDFSLSRTNRTFLGRWWWTVDVWCLCAVFSLAGIGSLLVLAASPSVATHYTWQSFHFIKRHMLVLGPALGMMIGLSWLSLKNVQRFALGLYIVTFLLLLLTFFYGFEIKGAQRWVGVRGGFSLQASEFIKPALAILCGWMFAEKKRLKDFPGNAMAAGLYGGIVLLLLLQPDFGMSFLITLVFLAQFFLSGLSLVWIGGGTVCALIGGSCAYFFLPHVQQRIHIFLNPGSDRFGEQFQISQALDAFAHGGLWGQGPGEGVIKRALPDAHADFIFAVAGEEFGFMLCALIIGLFGVIVLRSLIRAFKQQDLFILLASAGLSLQIGLQVFINIASTLHLIPPKGMTLPFISYGGSSLIASSMTVGLLLALTRKRIQV